MDTYFKELTYIDSLMLFDRNGRVIYSVKYNPRFDSDSSESTHEAIMGKNVVELYQNIDWKESTVNRCLENREIIYSEDQKFVDIQGRFIRTRNITLPIIRNGKILGAVELSRDITKYFESDKKIKKRDSAPSHNEAIQYSFKDIISINKEMLANIKKANQISKTDSPVLVYGETGTGKELFIHGIHHASKRSAGPFIALNCAALPETLFETTLFGSVKGAFTGAVDKVGLFEEANNGTLFLDELNSMPYHLQAKLLRVLQDGIIRRVGDNKERKVNVRVVCAMNEDPMQAIQEGTVRKDLFYRLGVMTLKLPPLRERREDIKVYTQFYLDKLNQQIQKNIRGISKEVEDVFLHYEWPGNVREIEHVIESAYNFSETEEIILDDLPVYLEVAETNRKTSSENDFSQHLEGISLEDAVSQLEKELIIKNLRIHQYNVTKTAEVLGITRQKLHYKMKKYDIR